MYKLDNTKTGSYIAKLIEKQYDSARQFCREYLKLSHVETDEGAIDAMANRLSQIKNGKNSIQAYDLPIFSELLNVSVEQILSAGKYTSEIKIRATNFSVAQSHNKEEWLAYIQKIDAPILNADEYGKTIIDYAIEFRNYDLLKFLINNDYIWFNTQRCDSKLMFGAGTNIQRDKYIDRGNGFYYFQRHKDLSTSLCDTQLRRKIISISIENSDVSMLEKLKAREIPELYYYTNYMSCCCRLDFSAERDCDMLKSIANSKSKGVIDYFTSSFEIKDDCGITHKFMFPYISELLDMLTENNNPFLQNALENAVIHNRETYNKLCALIRQLNDDFECSDNSVLREFITFLEKENVITLRNYISHTGISTNIAYVSKKSNNEETDALIIQLNKLFYKIRTLNS